MKLASVENHETSLTKFIENAIATSSTSDALNGLHVSDCGAIRADVLNRKLSGNLGLDGDGLIIGRSAGGHCEIFRSNLMNRRPFVLIFDGTLHLIAYLRLLSLQAELSLTTSLSDLVLASLLRFVFFRRPWFVAFTLYFSLIKLALRYLVFDCPGDQTFYVFLFSASALLSAGSTKMSFTLAYASRIPSSEDIAFSTYARQMFGLLGSHSKALAGACAVLVCRLPFSLLMPHFVSQGVGALVKRDSDELIDSVKWMSICGTMDSFLDFFCVYLFSRIQLRLVNELKLGVFRKLLELPLVYHDQHASGDLLSRITNDCGSCASELSWTVRWTLEALIRVSGVLMYMTLTSNRLLVLCLLVIPFNAALGHIYGEWSAENSKQAQTALGNAHGRASEALAAVATVKTFHQAKKEEAKLQEALTEHFQYSLKEAFYRGCYYGLVNTFFVNTVTQCLILYYGWLLVDRSEIQMSGVLAFLFYRNQLQDYANSIIAQYITIVRAAGTGKRIFDVLGASETAVQDGPGGRGSLVVSRRRGEGSKVEFRGVSMRYELRRSVRVLDEVSFCVPVGQKCAILGHSGAGKSSVLALLLNLYRKEKGEILIDDVMLEEYPVEELKRMVTVVSQEPVLFRGTLRENILYGLSEEDMREAAEVERRLKEALEIACLSEFVETLPEKLLTVIGERGTQLSGGQKQRVAIARAVVMNPRILLTDEFTSSLDSESEELVHLALQRAMTNRTVIMVSHRVASVLKYADYAIVMHAGKVVEYGTPSELLTRPLPSSELPKVTTFRSLYEAQTTTTSSSSNTH